MTPALSVAIPAHNEERYIGRCIESVLLSAERAGQAVEVAVALNRCTDATRSIAESLGATCIVEDKKCIAVVRNAAVRAGGIALVSSIGASGSALSPTFIGWMRVLTGSLFGAIAMLALVFLASTSALFVYAPARVKTGAG